MSSSGDPRRGIEVVVVMGVSGAGKTTVGRLLAQRLSWPFFDADDFHPESNRDKMAAGTPLDDDDRRPWLEELHRLIDRRLSTHGPAILACSALKASYRDLLGIDDPRVALVHLTGSPELLLQRLRRRSGHFMPPELLASQFDTLEPPDRAPETAERTLTLDVAEPPESLCRHIADRLGLVMV